MKQKHKNLICTVALLAFGAIYFTAGCKSQPETAKPLPNQPVIVQVDATGLWMWQYVASNNFLVVQSLDQFDSPKAALENYKASREAFVAFPDPRIERELKL